MKGYFTVEAACVLPLIFGIYVFLIYGMFYQYDRCLAQQDTVMFALEEEFIKGRDSQRYLACQWEEKTVRNGEGRIEVSILGKMLVPFCEIMEWIGEDEWSIEVSFTKQKIEPAFWIRSFRKILEGEK